MQVLRKELSVERERWVMLYPALHTKAQSHNPSMFPVPQTMAPANER